MSDSEARDCLCLSVYHQQLNHQPTNFVPASSSSPPIAAASLPVDVALVKCEPQEMSLKIESTITTNNNHITPFVSPTKNDIVSNHSKIRQRSNSGRNTFAAGNIPRVHNHDSMSISDGGSVTNENDSGPSNVNNCSQKIYQHTGG